MTRYEELRSQALGGTGRGRGLALFLRQGMKTWLEAFLPGPSLVPAACPPQDSQPKGGTVPWRVEITPLLAGMALQAGAK